MLWMIYSNEHKGWWRAARRGYTNSVLNAGEYSEAEAREICADANKHGTLANGDQFEVMHPSVMPDFVRAVSGTA